MLVPYFLQGLHDFFVGRGRSGGDRQQRTFYVGSTPTTAQMLGGDPAAVSDPDGMGRVYKPDRTEVKVLAATLSLASTVSVSVYKVSDNSLVGTYTALVPTTTMAVLNAVLDITGLFTTALPEMSVAFYYKLSCDKGGLRVTTSGSFLPPPP